MESSSVVVRDALDPDAAGAMPRRGEMDEKKGAEGAKKGAEGEKKDPPAAQVGWVSSPG